MIGAETHDAVGLNRELARRTKYSFLRYPRRGIRTASTRPGWPLAKSRRALYSR
jgi:hypothetical protein